MNIGRFIKDPFAALSHWFGAVLSVVGLVLLLVFSPNAWHTVGFAIYGACLIILYAASGLAHSLHCSPRVASWLDRVDYAAIFLLIAGTYTPLCLTLLNGPWGWSILGVEWGLAMIGIAAVSRRGCPTWLRLTLYMAMGWAVVIAARPVINAFPVGALVLIGAGGLFYSVGAVVFALDRPHIWPGKIDAHDLWHIMALIGSGCHFATMLAYLAPAA